MTLDSKGPDRFAAGEPLSDVLSASRLNQIPDAIDNIRQFLHNLTDVPEGSAGRFVQWIGEIVDQGPRVGTTNYQNFTDSRYWVKVLAVQSGLIAGRRVEFQDEPIHGVGGIYIATNIDEVAAQTHALQPGDRVAVFYNFESGSQYHLFFSKAIQDSILARLTSAHATGGVYYAIRQVRPTADIPAGATLAAADFGTDSGETVILLNQKEIGLATHDLLSASNVSDRRARAHYLYTNADGKRVFEIDKIYIGCQEAGEPEDFF